MFSLRGVLFASLLSVRAPAGWAAAFESATVTRLQNQVAIAEGGATQRPAAVADRVTAKDSVLTATDSRAELQFPDNSIVRVGQNTVFSFDAGSRTLSLQKGAMLFYVPPGSGGGTIKTPSLTAAITGTVGKATPNLIAVISGSIDTPWGPVRAGQAIRWTSHGPEIFEYNAGEATAGILYSWGPLPEIPEAHTIYDPLFEIPDLRWQDLFEINVLNPRLHRLEPPRPPRPEKEDEPEPDPTPRPTPSPSPDRGE